MGSRFRRPETTRLDISRGDWLLVKKHLTAGEEKRIITRMIKTMVAGERAILDPDQATISQVVEYLLDWSLTDPDGKPVAIRDKSPNAIAAALENLPPEDYAEIRDAVQAHDTAMIAERTAEKKLSDGASTSSPISESPA